MASVLSFRQAGKTNNRHFQAEVYAFDVEDTAAVLVEDVPNEVSAVIDNVQGWINVDHLQLDQKYSDAIYPRKEIEGNLGVFHSVPAGTREEMEDENSEQLAEKLQKEEYGFVPMDIERGSGSASSSGRAVPWRAPENTSKSVSDPQDLFQKEVPPPPSGPPPKENKQKLSILFILRPIEN